MGKATTPHASVRRRLDTGAWYTNLVRVEHTGRLELLDQVGKLVDGAALVEHLWGGVYGREGPIGRPYYKTLGRCTTFTHIHKQSKSTQKRKNTCKNARTDGPHELDLDAEVLQLLPRHQHHLHHAAHALCGCVWDH